jgi:hypothetical protein
MTVELLTPAMCAQLILCIQDEEPGPESKSMVVDTASILCALQAIADGRAVVVQWVSDRDPPVDQEVVTFTQTGSFSLWMSDKDEESGDWRHAGRNTHWLEGLEPPK